jgi:hypothetical protein
VRNLWAELESGNNCPLTATLTLSFAADDRTTEQSVGVSTSGMSEVG